MRYNRRDLIKTAGIASTVGLTGLAGCSGGGGGGSDPTATATATEGSMDSGGEATETDTATSTPAEVSGSMRKRLKSGRTSEMSGAWGSQPTS